MVQAKPENVLENQTHKILLGLELQTNHSVQTRKPQRDLVNKKKKKLANKNTSPAKQITELKLGKAKNEINSPILLDSLGYFVCFFKLLFCSLVIKRFTKAN